MKEFKKWPSIEQFRHVVKMVRMNHDFDGYDENESPVYNHKSPYPVMTFSGTVKAHGTNASFYIDDNDKLHCFSRSQEKSEGHFGFVDFMKSLDILNELPKNVIVYGEWFGQGIQKGVAISNLSKRFMVFGAREVTSNNWLLIDNIFTNLQVWNKNNIFLSTQFGSFIVDVDFNSLEEAQEKIANMVNSVENECPIGKYFGVTGVGEGIVFKASNNPSSKYWFKAKGEKHAVTKTKKIASIDVEKLASINEFVEAVVTESRLEQGISDNGGDKFVDKKNTGKFLSWVVADVMKEESDTLVENGLSAKDLNKHISNKARGWWFEKCDNPDTWR